jgi:hypothetical protein
MNAVEHNMPNGGLGHAPDVDKKANVFIWGFFLLSGIALYVLISLITIYFRVETEKETFVKIGSVESQELIDYKKEQETILAGQKGLVTGKKNISIDAAMAKVLEVTK